MAAKKIAHKPRSTKPKAGKPTIAVDRETFEAMVETLRTLAAAHTPKPLEPQPKEPPSVREKAALAALRSTGESPWAGERGLIEDASVGDVIRQMFHASTEDTGDDFMRTVVASVRDELAVLGLAAESGNEISELPKIAERLSNRLIVAQWLDDKMREANQATRQEGGAP